MLGAGGNAVDAAVASAFASFVAESTFVAPLGGGFAMLWRRQDPQPRFYDFFCNFPGLGPEAPAKVDFFPISVDYGPAQQVFHIGRGSVAVPGNIAGLCRLHADAGRTPLAEVLAPAIGLARDGVVIGPFAAAVGALLTPIFKYSEDLALLFGAPNRFMAPDLRYRNPDLAATLQALGREGPDLFYRGDIAQILLADQQAHGGLITAADLAAYRVTIQPPLRHPYRGYELLAPPPPARGGALVAFALALLQGYDLSPAGNDDPQFLRLLAEVMRQTNLARPRFEANGDAVSLLAAENVASHAQAMAGRLHGPFTPLAEPAEIGPNTTTHISVLDSEGTFVALTTTAGESAGFVLPGTGLLVNNIMGEEDLHPHGFHQGTPGQRIGSMMVPSIVLADGQPLLALGSGGANRIRSAILQVLIHFLDQGLDLKTAVESPRLHFEAETMQIEGGVNEETLDQLRRWGYDLVRWPGQHMFFGGVHTVGMGQDGSPGGGRRSSASRRGHGSADVMQRPLHLEKSP